jgi:hypothetical protein
LNLLPGVLVLRIEIPIHSLIWFLLLYKIDKNLEDGVEHDIVLVTPAILQRVNLQYFHVLISLHNAKFTGERSEPGGVTGWADPLLDQLTATYSADDWDLGIGSPSSLRPSKCILIAWCIFFAAWSFVLPVATHPGRSGEYAE